MFKPLKSTNNPKQELLEFLWKTKRRVWRKVAKELSRRNQDKVEVNLYRINQLTKGDDTIVIPGRVLSIGDLDHKIQIAAHSYSKTAREKLLQSKSKLLGIRELYELNPTGKNIKIIT